MSRSEKKTKKKKKGCNPLIAILILGAGFIVCLVVALFVGKGMLKKWVQGPEFQELVRKQSAEKLNADVRIDDVQWDGWSATVGKVTSKGYKDAAFSKMDLHGIRTDFSLVDNAFRFDEIDVSQASIEFSDDRLIGDPPGSSAEAGSAESDGSSGTPKLPGFLAKYAPDRVEIEDIIIGSASMDVKDANGESSLAVKNTRAQISPNLETGNAVINAQDGKLLLKGAPELAIRDAKLRWQDSSLFINRSSLGIYGDGLVEATGEVGFPEGGSPALDLNLDISAIDVQEVLPEDMKDKLVGTARGPIKVQGTPEAAKVTGTLHLDDGVLKGVKILDTIAKYTKTNRFSRLVLDQAQSDFELDGDFLKLRNIQIESNGLTRIEGVLDKNGESLAGVIQVGVTPATLKWIPGAENQVFNENRDGFAWTTVNIGGTTAKVEEDLSKRMMAAAVSSLLSGGKLKDIIGGIAGEDESGTAGPGSGRIRDRLNGIIGEKVGEVIDGGTGEDGKKLIEMLGPLFGR